MIKLSGGFVPDLSREMDSIQLFTFFVLALSLNFHSSGTLLVAATNASLCYEVKWNLWKDKPDSHLLTPVTRMTAEREFSDPSKSPT